MKERSYQMKKYAMCFAALLVLTAFLVLPSASAGTVDSGTCGDGLTWTLDSGGTLTISGRGEMSGYSYTQSGSDLTTTAPWGSAIGRMRALVIEEGVTGIGRYAFTGCAGLTKVTIPDSVLSIGQEAFRGCAGLTAVSVGSGVRSIAWSAFYGCSGLTSVTIPASVQSIGNYAFSACGSIKRIVVSPSNTVYDSREGCGAIILTASDTLVFGCGSTVIPASVRSIGDDAFYGCVGLTSVTIPGSVRSIGNYAFYNCDGLTSVTIPDSVASIGEGAFWGCGGLTRVTVPYGVGSVKASAFRDCAALAEMTLPDSVQSIGDAAFYGCASLTGLAIPDSVESIGASAFYGCASLKDVTIPAGVKGIGDYTFEYCTALMKVTIPDGAESIGRNAFRDCGALAEVTIPDSVRSIGAAAFFDCVSLTGVTVPDSVLDIGEGAFSGCASLTGVNIPAGLKSIGNFTFRGCGALTSVTIPEGVESVGDHAFYDCGALAFVTIPESVKSVGPWAFNGCRELSWVFYSGTREQWDGVYQGSNTGLTECRVHFGADIYSGQCGDALAYSFDPGTGALTLSGGGDMWQDMKAGPWIIFEDEVRSVFLPEGLGAPSPNAFAGCGGVRTAGPRGGGYDLEFAWSGTIPANAFSGMKALEAAALPDGLLELGGGAFSGRASLKGLRIPESVESIGADAVSGCSSLDSLGPCGSGCAIEIPWKEPCLGALLKNNVNIRSITFPEGITEIAEGLCSGCSGLEKTVVPATVKTIGPGAFSGCASLTELHLPHSLISVGSGAFSGCTALESATLPGCVGAVDGVFSGCTNLKEVRISNGATSIGPGAFSGCTQLRTLYLPRSVRTIGEKAFFDCEKLMDVRFTGTAGDFAGIDVAQGNGFLTTADFTYAENPVGDAVADVTAVSLSEEGGGKVVRASVYCAPDAEVTAVGGLYGRDGRFLGSVTVKLVPGRENELTIPVGDAYTVRIFSVSGADGAPVTPTANAAVG